MACSELELRAQWAIGSPFMKNESLPILKCLIGGENKKETWSKKKYNKK